MKNQIELVLLGAKQMGYIQWREGGWNLSEI